MLFNSAEFLLIFLPIALAGFYLLSRFGRTWATPWLVAASLYFYADWNPAYLWIIIGSMVGNFACGRLLDPAGLFSDPESPPDSITQDKSSTQRQSQSRRALLALGVTANLLVLGYYKYTNFLLANLSSALGEDWQVEAIVLPLAISFFTFQQIAYLVDAYRGKCREYSFASYCLFVTFFPQLIAGPIVHHSEMLPQFERESEHERTTNRIAIGLTILGIGLFKKVVVADGVAPYATTVFTAVDAGEAVTMAQAWAAALAYTIQLYFDFSGYSDMAIGAARLFGITLPINFYSPYKSLNIIDFWRRWHMTLSRFLRDYVYFSLGGNRKGPARRYVNLMATMLAGGIWHGAGWNFLIWGALHGSFLVINHAWHAALKKTGTSHLREKRVYSVLSWGLTFTAVVVGWVFFRAESFAGATTMLEAMFLGDPTQIFATFSYSAKEVAILCALLAATLFLPNTYEIMENTQPVLDMPREPSSESTPSFRWQPSFVWAVFTGALFTFALLHLGRVSEFLYFQF